MKESLWAYWIIVLGLAVLIIVMFSQNYTTTNEQDYYMLKEVTDAALADAIDLGHYRKYGEIRIIKEKFITDFAIRFAQNVNINKKYTLRFYDIYEAPPKVSVKVMTQTDTFNVAGDTVSAPVINKIDAIVEVANTKS